MKSDKKGVVVFKPYDPNQQMLLPPSLDEPVHESHPVRVINEVIDKINTENLLKQYKGGGTSDYHPKMLKVLVYGYLNNIYSSRKPEAATPESVYIMWLSGMARPDHHTINLFPRQWCSHAAVEVFKLRTAMFTIYDYSKTQLFKIKKASHENERLSGK